MNDIFSEPMLSIELFFIDPNRVNSYQFADTARTIIGERDNCDMEAIQRILENEEIFLQCENDDLSEYESISSEESEDSSDDFLFIFSNLIESVEEEENTAEEFVVQEENFQKPYFGVGGEIDPTKTPLKLDHSKLLDIKNDLEIENSGVFLKQGIIPIGTKIGYYEGHFSKQKNDLAVYIEEYDIYVTGDENKWTTFVRNDDTHYNLILTKTGSIITITEISAPAELIYSSFPSSLTYAINAPTPKDTPADSSANAKF